MAQSIVERDVEIQQQVMHELRWDQRVDPAEIGVAVHGGIVTLSGSVPSYAAKMAAQEAAHRVSGVLDVANDVEVTIPGAHARTDAEIAHAVRAALEWNVLLPALQIRSTVSNGWVMLEGEVQSWQQRLDAETAVRFLTGVRGVINSLTVNAPPVEAIKLQTAIEGALERRADREARRIRIVVEDGSVSLYGSVRTWLDKQAVLGVVGHAPGIRHVEDHLRIDPFV